MNHKRPDNPHVVCPECDELVHPMDLCCSQCVVNEIAHSTAALTDQRDSLCIELRQIDAARVQYRRQREAMAPIVEAARAFDQCKDGERWPVLLSRLHDAITAHDALFPSLDVACGMVEVNGDKDIVCGKPARRRIAGMDDGCCDECFNSMLRSFTRAELERQYPLIVE